MSIRVCPLCQAEFLDFKTTCTHCGVALLDPTEDVDFALIDEDDTVAYDLSGWPIDAQTEAAVAFAERGVPHRWVGTDLVVQAIHEEAADRLLEEIEDEFGIESADDDGTDADSTAAVGGDDDDADDDDADDDDSGEDLAGETEFPLAYWPMERRMELVERLVELHIAHHWEEDLLVVDSERESEVEAILDELEGGAIAGEPSVGVGEVSPAGVLSALFLASERLRKGKVDAQSFGDLVAALEGADPDRPPFGVDGLLWSRVIDLGDSLADAVAEDADGYEEIATELFDLLRPIV